MPFGTGTKNRTLDPLCFQLQSRTSPHTPAEMSPHRSGVWLCACGARARVRVRVCVSACAWVHGSSRARAYVAYGHAHLRPGEPDHILSKGLLSKSLSFLATALIWHRRSGRLSPVRITGFSSPPRALGCARLLATATRLPGSRSATSSTLSAGNAFQPRSIAGYRTWLGSCSGCGNFDIATPYFKFRFKSSLSLLSLSLSRIFVLPLYHPLHHPLHHPARCGILYLVPVLRRS